MNERHDLYRYLVFLFVCFPLLGISACRRIEERTAPTPASATTAPDLSYEEHATQTPDGITTTATPYSTTSPTAVPPVTETIVPSSTILRESTATPLPTLSPADGEALLRSLLQADDDCRLPCWWGISPGVTRWPEIEPFLASFASEMHRTANPRGSLVSYELIFYFPDRENPTTSHWALYHVQEGMISDLELNVSDTLTWSATYLLPRILAEYGSPQEIWLSTYDNTPSGERPFRISLIYSEERFVVSYETSNVHKEGERIIGCPLAPPRRAFLWVTDGSSSITFEQARTQTLHIGDDQLYLPLQEATDLTIEDFYNLFTATAGPKCFSTPAALWPF